MKGNALMAKPDYGYLVNGKIPANTPCPFRAECDQIGTAQCRYLGMPEATAYSCHVAQRLDTAHQKQCRIAAHEARQRAEHAEKLARQDWKQQHKALEAIAPHYRHTMDRFTPAEVLEHLSTTGIPRQYMGDDGQLYRVNMNSARYYTFRDNTHCACCGLEGTYFLLQDNQTRPGRPVVSGHFNLYGDDPVLGPVLFTKDHIIPVSRGGYTSNNMFLSNLHGLTLLLFVFLLILLLAPEAEQTIELNSYRDNKPKEGEPVGNDRELFSELLDINFPFHGNPFVLV